jgi:AcrR family transcriptional regulator
VGDDGPAAVPTRRAARRQETLRRILDAAWTLSDRQGLTGWTLRDLGAEVGMRAPSLYEYCSSKNDLFDLMFCDGYRRLVERIEQVERPADPAQLVRHAARLYVQFAAERPVRFQLLFQFTAPGFVPGPESMALARRALDELTQALATAGVTTAAEIDLWTAVLTGLASQQVSNDPGGNRWLRLVDVAVDRLLVLAPAESSSASPALPGRTASARRTRG